MKTYASAVYICRGLVPSHGIYIMSSQNSIVESKPFCRNDSMHKLTTRFLKGDSRIKNVESTMRTNAPLRPQQLSEFGRRTQKYWQTLVITVSKIANVKMYELIISSLLTAMPRKLPSKAGQHQCARSTGSVKIALKDGPAASHKEPWVLSFLTGVLPLSCASNQVSSRIWAPAMPGKRTGGRSSLPYPEQKKGPGHYTNFQPRWLEPT